MKRRSVTTCPVIYLHDNMPLAKNQRAAFSAEIKRRQLAAHLNTDPDTLEFEAGEHGKPALRSHPALHFSITHSGTFWAMAVDEQPLGCDIERHRPRQYMHRIAAEYFHAEEQAHFLDIQDTQEQVRFFYDLWTQKEAYGKFLGVGLHYDSAARSFLTDPPVVLLTRQIRSYSLSLALSHHCGWEKIQIKTEIVIPPKAN